MIKLLQSRFLVCLLMLCGMLNPLKAQPPGATCTTATSLAIGACAGSQTMMDFTIEGTTPAISCISGTFRREGWYSFTVPAGPSQNITASQKLAAMLEFMLSIMKTTQSYPLGFTINKNSVWKIFRQTIIAIKMAITTNAILNAKRKW